MHADAFQYEVYKQLGPPQTEVEQTVFDTLVALRVQDFNEVSPNQASVEKESAELAESLSIHPETFFLIKDPATDTYVGYVELGTVPRDDEPTQVTMGAWVAEPYRRRGVFTHVLALVDSTSRELGFQQIVVSPNDNSEGALRKFGYVDYNDPREEFSLIRIIPQIDKEFERPSSPEL